MAKACVFNVYGTLLDLGALDPFFARVLGDTVYRKLWYQTFQYHAAVLTLSDHFADFSKLGERALEVTARESGKEIRSEDWKQFRDLLETLPAFPDARPGLEALRRAGYRTFALTNAGRQTAGQALGRAGLHDCFDDLFSAEAVAAYKPAPGPYLHAAEKIKSVPKQLWFVAAHAWDTVGAHQAGYKTALLLRPGHAYHDLLPKPAVRAVTLAELASEIQNRDRTLLQKVFGAAKANSDVRPA